MKLFCNFSLGGGVVRENTCLREKALYRGAMAAQAANSYCP
jgi:hypothetical protein